MRIPHSPIISCLCLAAALVVATHARAETLQEVYKLAIKNDPKFRSVQAETRASDLSLDQAQAGFLPTIKYELERTKTRQEILSSANPIFGAGVTTFPTLNRTLSLTQPIFRKDAIERYAQAESVVKQAGYTLLAAEQDLYLRTMAAYLVVLAATDSLALATAEREAVGKLFDVAGEKRKAGLGTVTQLYDATARFAVTRARAIEAQNKLSDAQQGLREITGKVIENVQSLRDEFPLESPEPAVIDSWVNLAKKQNLILRARMEAVEVARLEVERQRAGHYPSVNMLVNRNQKDAGSTLFGGGSNVVSTEFTLRLTVPIYEGGMTSAVTEEAMHRFHKTQEDAELERRVVERATRAAFDGALSGVSLVQALKQSVVAQTSAFEAKTEGYKSGLNTLLPVLDAERDLFLAKRDYAQARYDYLLNRLKLKQAAGTLSEADLLATSMVLK